jgi:hypothetical protein
MSHFERNVEVPFDGPDGYTLSGKAEFTARVDSWGELDIDTDSLIVRVKGEVIGMDETVENDIINQLYGMSHDIIAEEARDMYEYRAETLHYR